MARSIQLLLVDNVEGLGIVGDVVKVKPGYARNFLLPHGHAVFPSAKKVEQLKEQREQVLAELAALRKQREALLQKMHDMKLTLTRSCNDQGLLYGSITQRDIADGLESQGYNVGQRSVRLGQPIKRLGEYQVPVQFDKDLRTEITLVIEADRSLAEESEEMDFDDEGNLIEPSARRRGKADAPAPEAMASATPESAPAEAATE